jgi:histone H4
MAFSKFWNIFFIIINKKIKMTTLIRRDSIYAALTKPGIQRLAKRSGVHRLSSLVYEEIRTKLIDFVEILLAKIITYTEYNRRKTISINDISNTLENTLLIPADFDFSKCPSFQEGKKNICLEFQRAPFERWLRTEAGNFRTDIRFETGVLATLQYIIETKILRIFVHARRLAASADRETIYPKDIKK